MASQFPTRATRPTRAQKPGGTQSKHEPKKNSLPASGKQESRPIPDPVDYMRSHSGVTVNGPAGAQQSGATGPSPMSPGVSGGGTSTTTKDSGAPQGFGGVPKKREPQGQKAQAKEGGGKFGLAPSNKKKAPTMTRGNNKVNPSRGAMIRRQHPTFAGSGAVPGGSGLSSRSGILSKFEGFTPNPN